MRVARSLHPYKAKVIKRLRIDFLEDRTLLSAVCVLVDGVLQIRCDGGNNLIEVGGNYSRQSIEISVNASQTYNFPATQVDEVKITGISAGDRLQFNPNLAPAHDDAARADSVGQNSHPFLHGQGDRAVDPAQAPAGTEAAAILHHLSSAVGVAQMAGVLSADHASNGLAVVAGQNVGGYANMSHGSSHTSSPAFSGTDMADHDSVLSTPSRSCAKGKSAPFCNCQQAQPGQIRSTESDSAKPGLVGPVQPREEQLAPKQVAPAPVDTSEDSQKPATPAAGAATEQVVPLDQESAIQGADAFFQEMGRVEQPSASGPSAALSALGLALLYRTRRETVAALRDEQARKRSVRLERWSLN